MKTISSAIAFLLLATIQGFGQIPIGSTFGPAIDPAIPAPPAGYIPTSGRFRALVLFTEFPGDTILPNDSRWLAGQAPPFMNMVIDSTAEQHSGVKDNLTTYFRDMSGGRLEVIGTARYVPALKPLVNYATSTKLDGTPEPEDQRFDVDRYVLRDILGKLDGTFDFAPFDNYISGSVRSPQPGSDGVVDLVILVYRCRYDPAIIPALAHYGTVRGTNDRLAVDNGARTAGLHVVISDGRTYGYMFRAYTHEMGQLLLNDIRQQYGGGIWTIAGGIDAVSYMMNSVERTMAGWCSTIDITSDTTIALADYARSNVAASIRISRPNMPDVHYYLENHQYQPSPYITAPGNDCTYDRIDRTPGARPGLYILSDADYGDLELVTADGAWDWSTTEGVPAPWNANQRIPVFVRGASNRNGGYSDRMLLPFYDPQREGPTAQPIYAYRDRSTGEIINNGKSFEAGDGNDAWRADENNIFSPWSNPATSWLMKDDSAGSGLAVHVLEQRGDSIIVRITFHDPIALPPSRPQDLHVDLTRPDPAATTLRWAPNIEPDVLDTLAPDNSPGRYELWRKVDRINGKILEEWHPIASLPANDTSYQDGDYGPIANCTGEDCRIPPIIRYRMRVRDRDGLWSTFSRTADMVPEAAGLELARSGTRCFVFPNPIQEEAQVFYTVARAGQVRIRTVSTTGEVWSVLVDEHKEEGSYLARIPTASIAAGPFFLVIEMADIRQTIPLFHVY